MLSCNEITQRRKLSHNSAVGLVEEMERPQKTFEELITYPPGPQSTGTPSARPSTHPPSFLTQTPRQPSPRAEFPEAGGKVVNDDVDLLHHYPIGPDGNSETSTYIDNKGTLDTRRPGLTAQARTGIVGPGRSAT